MDRLTAARVFTDVVDSGSFSATSERLAMSRSMVTRYVETLESWLKVRLLHRTTRKVSLTSEGQRYLPEIKSWLIQADAIEFKASESKSLSGTIRITASVSFGFSQLSHAIQSFMEIHKGVRIDVFLQDSVQDLTIQSIDLAIRISLSPHDVLIGKPIAVCESVIVASQDYLLKNPELVTITEPEELTRFECLGYKNIEYQIWSMSRGEIQKSVEIPCRLTANEATFLLHTCLNGGGIAQLPTYLATKYIQSGKLCKLLDDWQPEAMKIYALYNSRKHLPPAVRALIDYMEQYFIENPFY